jgi:phosphoribosylglycinamide formyltransferase-1
VRKIAIFASGSGSNYEAIMKAYQESPLQRGEVALVICDQPQAYVIERAEKWGTPTFILSPKNCESKVAYEQAILTKLQKYNIDFIVLAGYMRLLGSTLLQPYQGSIINIHPSLLPAFAGKDAIGQAIKYGVRLTGVTIHYVDEGMDTGPIIYQQAVAIEEDETKESLAQKIQAIEHETYPRIIRACLDGDIVLEEGKVRWAQQSKEQ